MKRLLLTLAVVAAALTLSVSNVAASGSGRVSYHSSQQLLIAKDRARSHKAPLYWSACLARYAKQQAQAMAARDTMYHSNVARLFGCRTYASQVGENVGVISTGGTAVTHNFLDGTVNNLFMASPHHRANILGPYHYVGTAWAQSANGDWFIAVEFA
jgi:uncharacterized protein YkwD